ncbi:MAG: IMPACT family protein [Ignavibacterium sp.]
MHPAALSSESLPEQIKTVYEFNESVYKEKSSEFIARIYHIENHKQAENILEKVRKKFFDATHHCFAYKLLNNEQKSSDDGEPKGTAGLRIMNAIDHHKLTNIMIVVIRYFGGTKLGVGPLGKAYYQSALNVIDEKKIVLMNLYQKISVQIEFDYISQFHRVVNNFEGIIDNSEYSNFVKFLVSVKPFLVDNFVNELLNITNGKAQIELHQSFTYIKS